MKPKRGLKAVAFEEWKTTRQTSTGDGAKYISMTEMEGWFINRELGFGTQEYPSLVHTLTTLDKRNEHTRKFLEAQATPPKVPRTPRERTKLARKKARMAGIRVRQSAYLCEVGKGAVGH